LAGSFINIMHFAADGCCNGGLDFLEIRRMETHAIVLRKKIGPIIATALALCLLAAIACLPLFFAREATAQPVSSAVDIFVAPYGDDANPGTGEKPVLTLQRAEQLVRAINQNMTGDINVLIYPGVYRLSAPLVFDARDSGTNGHNIFYMAQQAVYSAISAMAAPEVLPIKDPGLPVVISGGVQITGWKLIDAGKNLWAAPAPDSLTNTRQLYIDGVRATRTRGLLPTRLTETPTGYTAASDVMSHWKNPGDIEFVYTGGNGYWSVGSFGAGAWTEPRCPVASIDGTTITMAEPCWNNSTKRVPLAARFHSRRLANLVGGNTGRMPAYVENAYELLGTPGQFYFDRAARTIYYVPRAGEDLVLDDVEAPVLQQLVVGNGTPDQPIHNIIFSDLQFSYATWLYPSSNEGFSEIQANYMVTGPYGYSRQGLGDLAPDGTHPFGVWTPASGNVVFTYDQNIQFLNGAFAHLGGAGLQLGDGSQNDVVKGNVFTDISANGIELGNVDLPQAAGNQITSGDQILDNYIHDVATEFHGGIGIDVGYTQNTLIAHNQLDQLPYSAISMGWGGWPDKIQQPGVANISMNAQVEHNLIFNHMLLLADGGGIYTQGLTGPSMADGEKLIGNVIHDQYSSGHAIYTDNGCCNVTAEDNVLFHTNHDNWGGTHRDYYDDQGGRTVDGFLFQNNYWQQGDPDRNEPNLVLRNNHMISDLDQAPAEILDAAGLEPQYRQLLDEQFGKFSAPEAPMRVAVTAADGVALVSWNPPIFDGGAPVDSYTVTASGFGPSAGVNNDPVTITAAVFKTLNFARITGLTNGTYRFTVTATNKYGTSVPSMPSAPVTPSFADIGTPDAPHIEAIDPGNSLVSIHLQGPDNSGGGPVFAYQVTINPGERTVMLTGRRWVVLGGAHVTFDTIDGLTNERAYIFSVRAVNLAGAGAPATSRPVTPQ
jgi:Fibronectin type III domain